MKICRDICNGAEHLSLMDPSIGTGRGWNGVHREYDPFHDPLIYGNPLMNSTYVVLADFHKFTAFDLANRCLELWGNFLKDNSLL